MGNSLQNRNEKAPVEVSVASQVNAVPRSGRLNVSRAAARRGTAEPGLAENEERGREGGSRENGAARQGSESPEGSITEKELEEIDELSSPRAPVIYQIVRRHGEEELERPVTSLWWSGVAAGLSISFSLLTQAVLQSFLPHAPWQRAVTSLGYSVGFLMVVLGRQQLFTENTVTVVLPVMAHFTWGQFGRLGRMWTVVFAANMVGTLCAAAFIILAPVISPELRDIMLEISRHGMAHGWGAMLFRGVAAGFLIATMVWLLPSAQHTQLHIIVVITWLISAAGFVHIVAGAVEAFLLMMNGDLGIGAALAGFFVPVLIGNVIGGTALFALISYAQIMKEI
jgi:formate/nitrite transporter FocA (FNT family)